MAKAKKQRFEGIVYSTNEEYQYVDNGVDDDYQESLPPAKQNLRILLDRKQRGGKTVTLITGYIGNKLDLDNLGKLVKQKCGVGGSVKDGVIIIQGDFKNRILELLLKEGYKAKVSGG
jgi:translation initiation factor 1